MEVQARVVLPPELQEYALKGWETCRGVRELFFEAVASCVFFYFHFTYCIIAAKQYKDPCDRIYYTVKCTYNMDPTKFTFA